MTDQDQPAADDGAVKPFAAFLQEQRNGGLHAELSEALQEVAAACMEHGRAGSLTLKLDLKPAGNGANLIIADDVRVKAPEADRPVALWFADGAGNVSRRDPRQPELPLREIPDRKAS